MCLRMLRICFLPFVLLNLAVAIFCADEYSRADFPPHFIFGSGTSAYQVEGAANEDGRKPSVWDTFVHEGKMGGATADVSVDQYHKYKEDVGLMVETGLDAYRFSISWSRLIPNGRGPVNPKGLEYYNNLINELISNGIQPHVTIFHYDHPQALEDEYRAWISPKIVKDFTAYADACFREFGDRVLYWTTLNEPNVLPLFSYDLGILPPNRCSAPFGFNCSQGNSTSEPYLVTHHLLLAHASAARLYKNKYQGRQNGFIGINILTSGVVSLTNSTEDLLASQRITDFFVGLIMDPLVFGNYPDTVKKNAGVRLPTFTNYQKKQIKGSFDFIGINHYFSLTAEDNPASLNFEHRDYFADIAVKIGSDWDTSSFEYPINQWGLQEVLEYFKQFYGNPPIYIHENGQRSRRTSSLEDTSRVKYMHAYVGSVLDAIRNGSNTRGYFTWSFLDIFELLGGYEPCFGLYYVDINDSELKRYPKLSARWYSQFLKGGKVSSDGVIELPENSSSFSDNLLFQQTID
ncbi:beta-glucosidase 11 isoform X2 [Ricinus communis]|uniref:beta-glucosidase 11 isoform X2 n=1 Tax=Ricinus communis TaxID=3988 RepID=UPI00201AA844|nr:beta-glucosidase 11 isoform X2 [Ricinus communis]